MKEITLKDLPNEIDNLFNEYLQASFEHRQKALSEAADFMEKKLEEAAPQNTGEYKSSFVKKTYKDSIYIGNSKTVSGKGKDGRYRDKIPLSNILEYGNKPHIRQAFDSAKNQMLNIIKNNLGGK